MKDFTKSYIDMFHTLVNQDAGLALAITAVLGLLVASVVFRVSMNVLDKSCPTLLGSLIVTGLGVAVMLVVPAGLIVGAGSVVESWPAFAVLGAGSVLGVLVLAAPLSMLVTKGKYPGSAISFVFSICSIVVVALISGAVLDAVQGSGTVVDQQQKRKNALEQF